MDTLAYFVARLGLMAGLAIPAALAIELAQTGHPWRAGIMCAVALCTLMDAIARETRA